jgi:hypothetical protein
MKTCLLLTSTLAAFLASLGTVAQARPLPTIELVETYDLPGLSGEPQAINLRGDIAGSALRGGLNYGIARFGDGLIHGFRFDNLSTGATGINSSRTICGAYVDPNSDFYGFLLTDGVLTTYEPPAGYGRHSFLNGINDVGDLTGTAYDSTSLPFAFLTRDGAFIPIDLGFTPANIRPNDISSDGRVTGNYYQAPDYITYGFIRQGDGTVLTGIDHPAAGAITSCEGINARGWVIGSYTIGAEYHGFLFIPPHTFIDYDVPGATSTFLSGINDRGVICGYYVTSDSSPTRGVTLQVVQ